MMKLVLSVSTLGYIFAQSIAPMIGDLGPWLQLGAVGALGYVAIALVGELRASRTDSGKQREEHAKALELLMEKWNEWEKTRHEDEIASQQTMLTVVRTCAESRQAMVNTKAKPGG